jgi:RNA polymerase sigma factor (sigma-70 family)
VNLDRKAYEAIDWSILYKKLYAYAIKLVGGANLVIHCGFSAEDLVNETLLEFWESSDGLKWKKSKGSLDHFLGRVLRNNFLDHIRREKKVMESLDDEDFRETIHAPDQIADIRKQVQSNCLMEAVYRCVKGNQRLEDLVTAATMTTKDGKKNQQMADILATTTADIVNRKKQLLRITKIRELL